RRPRSPRTAWPSPHAPCGAAWRSWRRRTRASRPRPAASSPPTATARRDSPVATAPKRPRRDGPEGVPPPVRPTRSPAIRAPSEVAVEHERTDGVTEVEGALVLAHDDEGV